MTVIACSDCGTFIVDGEVCAMCSNCVACVDAQSNELHTCGRATSFPAEADTVASSPNAITEVRKLKTLPEE